MSGTAYPAFYEKCDITYYPTRADLPLAEWDVDVEGFDTIVFAHIYGRRAYPQGAIAKLKAKNPALIVIDDMAEAHGINPEGDIACYSFYSNKIVTTGEGGMCLTNSSIVAEEMRSLANMYFDKDRSMIHPKVGYNYRMTNIQAAMGLGQAEDLEKILSKRAKIEGWYNKHLPERMQNPDREVLWYYDIKVKNAKNSKYSLEKQGIATRRYFYPLSLQPWGNQMPDPNAMNWYKHGLLLPVYLDMLEADVKWICQTIVEVEGRIN
jgi:perosamine synthetase